MRMRTLAALATITALLHIPAASTDLTAWKFSQRLRINTTVTGAAVMEDVEAFPLLVRLTAAGFRFSDAAPNGADLIFTDAGGALLTHEIELWDADAGMAEIWLRVPRVSGNSASDFLIMRWGNPAAQPLGGTPVFGADNGFEGVWHLSEDGSGTGGIGLYKDATGQGRDGDDYVGSFAKDGVVGLGQRFDKTQGDHIVIPSLADQVSEFTLAAWVSADAVRMDWDDSDGDLRHKNVIGNFAWWPQNGLGMRFFGTQLVAVVTVPDNQWFFKPGVLTARRWTHVAITRRADGLLAFYADGVKIAEFQAPSDPIPCAGAPMTIGSASVTEGFDGAIDEVEHSGVARNEAWIKLAYENQRMDQRLVVFEPSDIVLQAGTTVDGLDGARLHLSAGSGSEESGRVTLMPGHTTRHSQRVNSTVDVGAADDPHTLRVTMVAGYEGDTEGSSVVLLGGSGINDGGRIVLAGGNGETSPNHGGGDIVLMPGGTSPSTPALPGKVVVGSIDEPRNLTVNGSIDFTGGLLTNGLAFAPTQWRTAPGGGIGFAGPVAVGGLDPAGYMLKVEGTAFVNGEILSGAQGSHYLVYTQKAGMNNGLYWDDAQSDLELWTNTGRRLSVKNDGRIGIGTDDPGIYTLAVEGAVGCRELVVTLDQWADDVFDSSYQLPSLDAVAEHIRIHKRLPGVPSQETLRETGLNVGEMQAIMMRKIEELTLRLLALDEQNRELRRTLHQLWDRGDHAGN
jgi:hypothetical protein